MRHPQNFVDFLEFFDVIKTSKLRTFVGQSAYFEPLLTFVYLEAIFKNRALARDVLKISLILFEIILSFSNRSKLRSRAERPQNFDDVLKTRVPARDVLKNFVDLSFQG